MIRAESIGGSDRPAPPCRSVHDAGNPWGTDLTRSQFDAAVRQDGEQAVDQILDPANSGGETPRVTVIFYGLRSTGSDFEYLEVVVATLPNGTPWTSADARQQVLGQARSYFEDPGMPAHGSALYDESRYIGLTQHGFILGVTGGANSGSGDSVIADLAASVRKSGLLA